MRRTSTSLASRNTGASTAQRAAFERARTELLALPARLFSRLPVATRIEVQNTANKQVFVWTSDSEPVETTVTQARRRREERRLAETRERAHRLDGAEVDAVVLGLEAERVFSSDLTAFSLRKLHDPGFRVTEAHALAGIEAPVRTGRGPTLGAVLAALELELIGIDVGSEAEDADRLSPAAAPAAA
jgi:hypothetical protein